MMTRWALLVSCALLGQACVFGGRSADDDEYPHDEDDEAGVFGDAVYKYVPLNDQRSWEYRTDESGVSSLLGVEKLFPTQEVDAMEVVTLEYRLKEPEELLYSINWSSDLMNGVLIHGWEDPDSAVIFDTPVVFGSANMFANNALSTTTNGMTYTSHYVAVEACPNNWTLEDWDCLHFSLDDGDEDPSNDAPFVGDWWMATDWGASWIHPANMDEPWVLTYAHWEENESE